MRFWRSRSCWIFSLNGITMFFFWDDIPGFSAVYGFVSCVLIVVISKALGHYWLERSEDYYND